ncbi:unnamed protein product [Strongylus vulgaris]|uniref:DUF4371 domain-containing protein n=1 Tax=Strongylus vulgaris TaxID=40348 RepID=A0A3P7LMX3_STRVU|nr:unnamed protein product [Strongylus vulgaris]
MAEAETGRYMFETIYAFFARENLLDEYAFNLVALATDGASAMNAEGGLRGILNANVSAVRRASFGTTAPEETPGIIPDAPVIWIHCMAHKIELASSDAFAEADDTSLRWRKFATTFLNKLRVFFAAPSRRRVLLEVDSTLTNEHFINLKRIIALRWTSSEES